MPTVIKELRMEDPKKAYIESLHDGKRGHVTEEVQHPSQNVFRLNDGRSCVLLPGNSGLKQQLEKTGPRKIHG